jgi:hypothetical protein
MEGSMAWRIDPDTLHVAEDERGQWKVLREGAPTAESRHGSKFDALDAARQLAQHGAAEQIKVHEPSGRLERTVDLDG